MSEEKIELLDEEHEAELLRALAAQVPVEDFKVTVGDMLPQEALLASKDDVINALRSVCDPEIPINIYDMGFIYDIRQLNNGNVEIDMTLTAPTCPVAEILPRQAAEAVAALCGTGEVTVKVVWEPAWTPERMTEEGKAVLELF